MTGQPRSIVQRGPSPGPVCVSRIIWACLRFGSRNRRWHIVVGRDAVCGRLPFKGRPYVETTEPPANDQRCKRCVEKVGFFRLRGLT